MDNSNNKKPPMPHNGKKVNDWETLRPYVEEAAPPLKENIAEEGAKSVKIDPKWGFGYQAELSGNNSTFSPEEE